MSRSIGFLGGGSQAAETAEYEPGLEILFRALPADRLRDAGTGFIDIATQDERFITTSVVAAVGLPGVRRDLVGMWGGNRFASVVSPTASISPSAQLGTGCIIAPGTVITAGAILGDHVILNVGASVSHTSTIGAYTTISPGVRIAGDCSIGAGCFIGIGAIVSHGVSIASGSVVGAGAVVLDDIESAEVVVGNPARRLRLQEDWIVAL